jgi:hypothetical protein
MQPQEIKNLINKEIEIELKLKRNNPDSKSKNNVIVKTNYLKERLEHLRNRLFYFIDNQNQIRKEKQQEQPNSYNKFKGLSLKEWKEREKELMNISTS